MDQDADNTKSNLGDSSGSVKNKLSNLPFSKWHPLLGGAIFGIFLRLVFFGAPGAIFTPMGGAFIYFVPFAVGAITVYMAEKQKRRNWTYYFWASAVANMIFVLGTLVIMIEGLICVIVVAPLFGLIGGVGGLIMGAVCRITSWPRQTVYGIGILPLLLGALPVQEGGPPRASMIEDVVVIRAPANIVWEQLLNARAIRPDEVGSAWMYRIGVPLPIAGISQRKNDQLVRQVSMGKGIQFEQVANEWRQDQFVHWNYRFLPDSVPPKALDDHVKIGGHYFDLIDTRYAISPVDDDHVELKIQIHYRVSTDFDWYADRVAQLLIGNFETTILSFYRKRAEESAVSMKASRS